MEIKLEKGTWLGWNKQWSGRSEGTLFLEICERKERTAVVWLGGKNSLMCPIVGGVMLCFIGFTKFWEIANSGRIG